MRKGEKLFNYLMSKIENMEGDPVLSPAENDARDLWFALQYLEQMDDNVFNKIIYGENYIEGFEIGAGT